MKNLNLNQLKTMLATAMARMQKYGTFTFTLMMLIIYTFLVVRISVLSQSEPSEAAVAEQTNTIKRLKIDQNSIDKIQQLEDQNVGVQSLFETARDNPFQD